MHMLKFTMCNKSCLFCGRSFYIFKCQKVPLNYTPHVIPQCYVDTIWHLSNWINDNENVIYFISTIWLRIYLSSQIADTCLIKVLRIEFIFLRSLTHNASNLIDHFRLLEQKVSGNKLKLIDK